MSTPAAAVSTIEQRRSTVAKMHVVIHGRIESQRTFEGKRYTTITTPAIDQYSRPQIVNVRSTGRIGEKGEEVTITAILGGYTRKAYDAKDKETGEIRKVVPVEHSLDLVE